MREALLSMLRRANSKGVSQRLAKEYLCEFMGPQCVVLDGRIDRTVLVEKLDARFSAFLASKVAVVIPEIVDLTIDDV